MRMGMLNVYVCFFASVISAYAFGQDTSSDKYAYACDSKVYCQGLLLDVVQRTRIFQDSKTFVDMTLKYEPDVITEKFSQLYNMSGGRISRRALKQFTEDNLSGPGDELEEWTPADWTDKPTLANRVKDPRLRHWVLEINKLWKSLGRKMKDSVKDHPDRHSLLYVPNPFIIPGSRFREFYYWDSYWIMNGLLASDMKETAKGMIENFLYIVNKYGHVPNGGRVYYLGRSQPPMLTPMVGRYYDVTGDKDMLAANIHLLEKEYQFWMANRTVTVTAPVTGTRHNLTHYMVNLGHPRPEGYLEDVTLTDGLSKDKAASLYSNVAAACESGWDFSTRWFGGESLKTIKTSSVLPVDLNSLLAWNEHLLAKFHGILGNREKQQLFAQRAVLREGAIKEVMWREDKGSWFDYHMDTKQHNEAFYPSNIFPLFTNSYDTGSSHADRMKTVERVLQYIRNEGVLNYPGGIPTSLKNSGQQWDFPNAWSPAVHLFIESLSSTQHPEAEKMAQNITNHWLYSNWQAWKHFGHMYEKYDVRHIGEPGGGGEYEVQLGFGWTNGVVLQLIDKYAETIILPMAPTYGLSSEAIYAIVFVIVFTAIAVIGVVYVWRSRRCCAAKSVVYRCAR
ncbi:hypothetical protein NP493_520g01046 [Ridgeia piscesae]|uniref:Trehalase n=1 Tax=Ridgeia piscesae TaxID=27915 RepID=A0AAD9KY16_RIDPI|nr:hypothetical protein NP493_520g01046 [Ridgeia piscesae]